MSIHARFRLPYPAFTLDIDVDLPAGGVTAVFGRSGSGKTTLLRCIAGLEQTLDGSLIVSGETWQDGSYRRPVHQRALGYVFQEARLFPHLSVAANLDFGRRRIAESERRVSLAQVVELLGIAHLLERRPERLSGGERQRVAIARALATSPRLLLMDEPLAALDQARKQEILPYLERLHDELAIPVLYVSHSPDEVARLADHIVLMEDGRAVAQGPLTETLARVDLPLRLGEDVGVVFSGQVLERNAEWHLARIGFAGGEIWVRDGGAGVGRTVRLRILARDVSIARHRHDDVSIMNLLPATIITHAAEDHPALALLQLQVGGTRLLARLTRHSANRLELAPGQQVWVQIKAVALLG
ncbi:molybdenum ABC transporter ATP-binding protein [Accumulibacter sp.]|uniref:Molybdate ABC transporter, ATPase subunit n=1 Tax=Accumulibacter regalis TaxID=522306 RepID=C7RRH3_ACCRE|nr:molybdenum ABC transporter ATP-binding protein [Accumulibacter sp.]MBN8496201.1 molybdenum ABC transporter ATP-binding protein [Accumulibacter sp.]MBO3713404.1 molybdenum ABC transporter ATP-binding protein [Accumulibacter sp.]